MVDGQKCEMEQRAHFPLGKITLEWGCEAWRARCCHIWMPHPFSGCCGRCCRMRLGEIPTLSKGCHGGDHTLRFGCCSQSTLFLSLSPLQCPGESPAPGQDKVCPAHPAGMLHPRMGKGNHVLSYHKPLASLGQSPRPLAAAEEPQRVPVFIPSFLISPASARARDWLFI